jgi:hypothetical protein
MGMNMLIEEWNKAHKLLSVQIAAVTGVLAAAYDYLPAIHQYLPEGWVKYAAAAIILARVIKQKETS